MHTRQKFLKGVRLKELCGQVFERSFSSAEQMIKAAVLLEHEEYQLDNGTFKGYQRWIHTSNIQLSYHNRSRGINYQGKTPKDAYVLALIKSDGKVTHNGLRLHSDELIVLNENDKTDLTTSESSEIIGIVFDKDFFEAEFAKYFNQPFEYNREYKRIQLQQNTAINFKNKLNETLKNLMTQGEDLKRASLFHDNVEQTILQILFSNLDLSKNRKTVLQSDIDANRIREYINLHYKECISVKEFYSLNNLSVSNRTIRSGFKRLFGFSIKQYIQQYRLGKMHYALLKADTSSDTVENIAYDHGFSHMGRFHCKYKVMYGETPYTTLKMISPM